MPSHLTTICKRRKTVPKDWVQHAKNVIDIEIEGLASVRERLGPSFSLAVELLAACRGRVAICGIGKSGLVGRKIAATFSSTGTPAFFLHPVEGAHGDLGSIRSRDIVIAISHSGKTDELNAILPVMRSLGARIIAITAGLESPLAQLSDLVIDATISREACPMNLAPTSSTTATLALGDALAICLMESKAFTPGDFKRFHPGGALGQRLSLKIADIMHTGDLPIAREDQSFREGIHLLDEYRQGAVLITDSQGQLSGILTDGDVRKAAVRGAIDPATPLSQVMTPNPKFASPEMSAAELMDIMEQKAITVLPVLDASGVLAGLVHIHDLLGKGQIRFASHA